MKGIGRRFYVLLVFSRGIFNVNWRENALSLLSNCGIFVESVLFVLFVNKFDVKIWFENQQ